MIFLSTDKENDKNLDNNNLKQKLEGKQKLDDEDKQIGKLIDNKVKALQKFKLKACMKFKGHCHIKCNCLHNLSKEQEKEFEKFVNNMN
jgi:hypothetical protein